MQFDLRGLVLLALPTISHAISLSDFSPRADNLPQSCEDVYEQQIPACTEDDFTSGQCSRACVSALYGLVQPVKQACGNKGVTGQNLIVAYLANAGPQQVCPNAPTEAPMGGGPWTSWAGGYPGGPGGWPHSSPTGAWTSHWPSTKTQTPTTAPTTTGTPIFSGSTEAASLNPSAATSLIVDTSSTPTTEPFSQTPTASPSGNAQTNYNDQSGGGSPFDTAGNMGGAASLSLPQTIVLLSTIAALVITFR